MTSGDIPNQAITASSVHTSLFPNNGRLLWTKLGIQQCWAAGTKNQNQWLQIDLSRMQFISGVATQGRHRSTQWVMSYWLSHSNDGGKWNYYQNQMVCIIWSCHGNSWLLINYVEYSWSRLHERWIALMQLSNKCYPLDKTYPVDSAIHLSCIRGLVETGVDISIHLLYFVHPISTSSLFMVIEVICGKVKYKMAVCILPSNPLRTQITTTNIYNLSDTFIYK